MESKEVKYVTVGQQKIEMIDCELPQAKLRFWAENPRVYSILNQNDIIPEQSDIQETMCNTEHVKELKESIRKNGGLMEPILVRDGDYVVLEGNSRLAAYRILAESDPVKWGMIRAKLLPANVPDSVAFTLIGQYHIVGKKNWDPYEQAGYIYRIMANSGKTEDEVSDELNLPKSYVSKLLRTYNFMQKHNENNPSKWSHYDELSKSRGIRKAFKKYPGLEDEMVRQIKNNEIPMAIGIRLLGEIYRARDKQSENMLQKIASGEITMYEAHKRMDNGGKFDDQFMTCSKFRKSISEEDFLKKVLKDSHPEKIAFELSKIAKIAKSLVEKIERETKKIMFDFIP